MLRLHSKGDLSLRVCVKSLMSFYALSAKTIQNYKILPNQLFHRKSKKARSVELHVIFKWKDKGIFSY